MVDLRAPEDGQRANYNEYNDPYFQRRAAAFQRAANELLGNVPGIGQFGFTYVAVVMIGLMIIVGPIDWLVLRYLGRQPWTWVTTSGWIALVTTCALFIGHLFKSGDLHFRTLRVIDQADGQVIATTDFVGVYAPRTRVYEIVPAERESWWQPGVDFGYGYGNSMRTEVPFGQDAVSNRLLPMIINVWNLRFLNGQTVTTAPPVIDASLAWAKADPGDPKSANKVVGTITNKGSVALRDIIVRVGKGALRVDSPGPLGPGDHIDINQPFKYDDDAFTSTYHSGDAALPIRYSPDGTNRQLKPGEFPATSIASYWYLGDLAVDRSQQIDRLLSERPDVACVYAEGLDPQPAVTITDPTARQQHWQVVRALVPISTGEKR
jgi:hypothetical protein